MRPRAAQHCGVAGVQALAGAQNDFVGRRFRGLRIDELARRGGAADANVAVLADGVLDHHHRIFALRPTARSSTISIPALPGPTTPAKRSRCGHLADDFQLAGQVGGAHRIPVANRAGGGGHVPVGSGVFGQHAPGGRFQGHLFNGGGSARGAYGRENGLAGLGERQRRHYFYYERLRSAREPGPAHERKCLHSLGVQLGETRVS